MHECSQMGRLIDIENNLLKHTKEDEKRDGVMERMEGKIDKVLYFVMGFFGTAFIAFIGLIGSMLLQR